MRAYALVSKPCSEDTDIGYIFSGSSGCLLTPANSYLMYYLNARYSPMTLPTIENGESCGTMIGSIVSFSG